MMRRKARLNDGRLRWIGMILLSLLYTTAVNLPAVIEQHRSWIRQYATDFVFVVICWTISRELIIYTQRRFPGIHNTRPRVITMVLGTILLSLLQGFAIVHFLNATAYYAQRFSLGDFFYTGGLILVFSMMIMAIYEAIYSVTQWNTLAVEAETLKRENLQSQLDSLKEQVKPHFLFNSLSTLIGLIEEDKVRAQKFVEELAYVYRYLLQSSEKELIPLAEELSFIKAYYYLLKTRFENRLNLDIQVSQTTAAMLIPPLTLQILLENAVKHNIISTERPLEVKISEIAPDRLEVSNVLQRRSPSAMSTQTGLTNLATKFSLMKQQPLEISITDDHFKVTITLFPIPGT